MFELNLKDFLLSDPTAMASNPTAGQQITAKELLSGITGGDSGTFGYYKQVGGRTASYGGSLANQIRDNVMRNWVQMTAGVILIPVVARAASKLIRKPVILPANRMLKSAGLDVKV